VKEILDLNDLNLNDLSKNTIAQLREFGKELGIKSVTRYRKSELIDKIQEKLTEMSKSQMKQMEAEVPPEEQAAAEQPVKKKRGRPKKSESESTSQTESQEEIVQITLEDTQQEEVQEDSSTAEEEEDMGQAETAEEAGEETEEYEKKVAYAKKYYNREVVWQVAELAASMENEPALR